MRVWAEPQPAAEVSVKHAAFKSFTNVVRKIGADKENVCVAAERNRLSRVQTS